MWSRGRLWKGVSQGPYPAAMYRLDRRAAGLDLGTKGRRCVDTFCDHLRNLWCLLQMYCLWGSNSSKNENDSRFWQRYACFQRNLQRQNVFFEFGSRIILYTFRAIWKPGLYWGVLKTRPADRGTSCEYQVFWVHLKPECFHHAAQGGSNDTTHFSITPFRHNTF